MECPKCGYEVDDNAMTCPNCKKVLKLICPVCRTVNTSNSCKKCGFQILVKCNNCGKIVPNINGKCAKCGFDTEQSCVLNDANTDIYAMMIIDLPNIDDMKNYIGSSKLLNKFKANTDKIIKDVAKKEKLKCRLYGNSYVIRFTKEYTFSSSAAKAMETSLTLLQEITKLNCKLSHKKNCTIRCNISLIKKETSDNPRSVKSDFNVSFVNQDKLSPEEQILSAFQIITDSSVYDVLKNNYDFEQLDSVMVNGEMVMFYEAKVKDKIELIDVYDEPDEIQIPNFVQNMLMEQDKIDGQALRKMEAKKDPDAIYDMETIGLEDVQAEFMRVENADVLLHMVNRMQAYPKGILAIKTDEIYKPYSLKIVNEIESLGIYKNIISITCYDDMKYAPYSFFRDLVAAIFEYTISQKLFSTNDFTMFQNIDPDLIIRDLITLTQHNDEDVLETRFKYYDIFASLLQAIPNSLIFIEDFEKIDAGSLDIMRHVLEVFEELDISYLISYNKKFSLHKNSSFLLSKPYYCEILLKPTPFEKIIADNKDLYKNILDSFYLQRIAKYACGSILFLDFALQYLLELEVIKITDDGLKLAKAETILIPSSLNKLLVRRLNLMKDEKEMLKFLASMMLLGTRVDVQTMDSLGYENSEELINRLSAMGYIYYYNNCFYFPNYNLLKENLLETMNQDYLKEVAGELFEKVFDENIPSPTKAYLYSLLGDHAAEFGQWEKLANINLSLGDFCSYLNCAQRMIDLVNENNDEYNLVEDAEEFKDKMYNAISNNIFEVIPEKTSDIAENTLKNLERLDEKEKIVELCIKMIKAGLQEGDYNKCLELMHKVLSLLPNASIDPNSPNFDKNFFLMSLVHIVILFNLGAVKDCLDIGYKILEYVTPETLETLRPEDMEGTDFIAMLYDTVGYVAICNICLLAGNVGQFLELVKQDLPQLPASFQYFVILEQLVQGKLQEVPEIEITATDRFSPAISFIISAFAFNYDDPKLFATDIYRAKINAKNCMLHKIEAICDLLIANTYIRINSIEKASHILYDIIDSAQAKGMAGVELLAWYFMSNIHIHRKEYDVAYGVINNSIIQLEKNRLHSELLIMLLNYNLYKVFMFRRELDKAQLCIEQAIAITQKHEMFFPFDVDPRNYGIQISDEIMAKIQNGEQVDIEAEETGEFLEGLAAETEQEEQE